MATHDHTARTRPFVPGDQAFPGPPDAHRPAYSPTAPSLRLSTLDDVALALYSLAVLHVEDQWHRATQDGHHPAELMTFPLPRCFGWAWSWQSSASRATPGN